MVAETVVGLADLSRKLNKLSIAMGKKTLRSATLQATLPAFRAMKLAAPVGSVAHRTYKGNLVSPGFLKRSVKRVSGFRRGVASVALGVKAEAFYGVSFVDRGTVKMPAQSWFVKSFIDNRKNMEERLRLRLGKIIERVAKQ